jgi:hypothetical protein
MHVLVPKQNRAVGLALPGKDAIDQLADILEAFDPA